MKSIFSIYTHVRSPFLSFSSILFQMSFRQANIMISFKA